MLKLGRYQPQKIQSSHLKIPRQLTATKTSDEKWIHIFSVSIVIIPTLSNTQANSSGAEFLSTISKFIKRNIILSLPVYVLHKTWNWHFHVVALQWRQRNVQSAKLFFALSSYCFFYFLVAAASSVNLILFTTRCDPSETEFSQCKLNCSCW